MTTVLQVITHALKDANVLGEGESASADVAQDALATLNQMLALWQIDNLFVYAQQDTSFSPTGAVSYTVGTGANVNMARPARIDGLYWRSGTLDDPITLLDTFEQYEAIAQKTQAGEPLYAFYLPSYPYGTLYLTPQPSTGSVHLITQANLPAENAIADTLTLPPAYVLPIRANLAVLLCGTYGAPVRPSVAAAAVNGLRMLKRSNLRVQPLGMPAGIPGGSRPNIISGV
jgi:hypothetical protein